MNPSKIVLIPPNGQFKKQDFSLQRINKWLVGINKVEVILLHIKSENFSPNISGFQHVIEVEDENELFRTLRLLKYHVIFHRSWMGSYDFAAKLVEKFENVIVNLKDWNFASQEVYEFLFPKSKDFEGMEYIFKHCNTILSHFTKEQACTWAKEYNVSEEKFFFFPEFCNKDNFNKKPQIEYKNISLVYAGAIPPTCFAEDYFPGKSHLRSIKLLTKQKINIDFVLPPNVYNTFFSSKDMYLDFIYESETNKRFNLIKGKELGSEILNKYHFGFFELETSGINHDLYKYAVTSKFAFYLEAGLPMLVNEKFVAIAQLVEENGLGIIFHNKDMKNLNTKLKIAQNEYDSFCENIKKFRKNFTYTKNKIVEKIMVQHD